jgi:hypothetical protein
LNGEKTACLLLFQEDARRLHLASAARNGMWAEGSIPKPKELKRSSRHEFRLVFRNEMATIWHKLNL